MLKAGDYIKTSGGEDLKATLENLSKLGYGAVVSVYSGTEVLITSVPDREEAEPCGK